MGLFVVQTIGFELLYGFVIVRIDRRDLVWINVATNPTAEWIARQITEAFPWDDAPFHGASILRKLSRSGDDDRRDEGEQIIRIVLQPPEELRNAIDLIIVTTIWK
jgi:hypothetical protein